MNLEQQKTRALERLRAIRAGDAAAIQWLRRHHVRWHDIDEPGIRQLAALHDAQFALAREQGFAGWTQLKSYARAEADPGHTHLFVADLAWLEDRVRGLLAAQKSGVPAALEQIRDWHPQFAQATDDEIRQAPFTEEAARLVYAHEHGFRSWEDLAARVAALAEGRGEEPFMAAFKALERRDLTGLESLLAAHPDLALARGTNGNTLLNLEGSLLACAAKRPLADDRTALAGIELLLGAGARADEPNDRGWTPLHQAAYSNQPQLAERLIAAGASLDAEAHGAGGTPLVAALFWGHREAAGVLAGHGVVPANLRVAAGAGDLRLLESLFTAAGALAPQAGAARGFYRPHSGFPDWQPSNDPQEILDEALVWACKSDRVEVLEPLVRRGARIDADPYRGTPLIWAAACNRVGAAAWLLDHGAGVNQRATFGGPSHGQGVTALHLAAQNGHLAMVTLLVARGADLSIADDLYHATPAGWAEHSGHTTVSEYIRSHQP